MYGRYGVDAFGKSMLYALLVLIVLSVFVRSSLLNLLICALLLYAYYRMLSKNHAKRYAENQKYLQIKYRIQRQFRTKTAQVKDRENRIFKCPACGQKVRVPRGKGKISIHCPKCQKDFVKRS